MANSGADAAMKIVFKNNLLKSTYNVFLRNLWQANNKSNGMATELKIQLNITYLIFRQTWKILTFSK